MINPKRFFGVTFFSALVLLVETVLFHFLMYLHDYFVGTAVIAFAVCGIGVGAFIASRVRISDERLFTACCIGATVSLYVVSAVLVRYPSIWLVAASIALCVIFPIIYITVLFREHPGGRVYFYDMAGAFSGVVAVVLLYTFLNSESIILLLMAIVPLIGLAALRKSTAVPVSTRKVWISASAMLAVVGTGLLVFHLATDRLNFVRIYNRECSLISGRTYTTVPVERLVRSYDSLIERIDITDHTGAGNFHLVWYNGHANDHFQAIRRPGYAQFKKENRKWPLADQRIFYGFKDAPSVFIIGAAAWGIVPAIKYITPASQLTAVEIDPSIVKIMTKDFHGVSGGAYDGLDVEVGNAISRLNATRRKFDIITLINTHSGRTIGYPSGPDFLHTKETYGLYFNRLSEDGYLLFEERVFNRGGDLAFYRMLNTLWHTLKDRGAADPSNHFLIWEWDGASYPHINRSYDADLDRYKTAEKHYYGMIVTREPILGPLRSKAMEWLTHGVSNTRVDYLKGLLEWGEFSQVFKMIEKDDFSALASEGFDSRPVTNDIPFPSLSRKTVPQIRELIIPALWVFGCLILLFSIGTVRGSHSRHALSLLAINILIGLGYFFIEIMLLQVYQNIFVSASWSLILVLGLLLLSSGIGGMYARRLRPWLVTAILIPVAISAVFLPGVMAVSSLPFALIKLFSLLLIGSTGFCMGLYFPHGLEMADRWAMSHKVPHLFAVNSVAGSAAVLVALYLGVRVGYATTVIIAALCYCVAGILITVHQKAAD